MQSYILQGKDFFAPEEQGSEEEILRRIVNGHLAPTPLCRSAFCETALDTERRLGVSYYLDKERIGGLFRALSKLSCEGSGWSLIMRIRTFLRRKNAACATCWRSPVQAANR